MGIKKNDDAAEIQKPSEITCLAEAIAYVSAHVGAVGKIGKNKDQGYNFRPVDEFMNQINNVIGETGMAIYPHEMIVLNDTARTAGTGKHINCVLLSVRYKLRWKNEEDIAMTLGYGEDYGDKHVNKGMAFAYKYLLMELFHIPTRDLIDGDESSATGMEEAKVEFTAEQVKAAKTWLESKKLYPPEVMYKDVPERSLKTWEIEAIVAKLKPEEIEFARKALAATGVRIVKPKAMTEKYVLEL